MIQMQCCDDKIDRANNLGRAIHANINNLAFWRKAMVPRGELNSYSLGETDFEAELNLIKPVVFLDRKLNTASLSCPFFKEFQSYTE